MRVQLALPFAAEKSMQLPHSALVHAQQRCTAVPLRVRKRKMW
jgi:hypothetical protein